MVDHDRSDYWSNGSGMCYVAIPAQVWAGGGGKRVSSIRTSGTEREEGMGPQGRITQFPKWYTEAKITVDHKKQSYLVLEFFLTYVNHPYFRASYAKCVRPLETLLRLSQHRFELHASAWLF